MVNSGLTTGTLLWTYELFAKRVSKLKLDLPESGNGTPDLLNEVRWNLDWMLKMQDADGGVWHKQTSEGFCGFVMPEKDTLDERRHRHGRGPVQELVRDRRLRRGDGHRLARLPALRRGLRHEGAGRRAPGLDLARDAPRRSVQEPGRRLDRRVRRSRLLRRAPVGRGRARPNHRRGRPTWATSWSSFLVSGRRFGPRAPRAGRASPRWRFGRTCWAGARTRLPWRPYATTRWPLPTPSWSARPATATASA